MPVFSAHDSITKLALMTLAAFGFALVGLWAATFADLSMPDRAWMGWIIGLFFGLIGCIGLMRLWNAGEQVRISSDGIYVKKWSEATIPWPEISDVSVWEFKRQRSIVLHLQNPDSFPATTLLGGLAVVNRAITSGDIAITFAGTNRSFNDAMLAIVHFRSNEA